MQERKLKRARCVVAVLLGAACAVPAAADWREHLTFTLSDRLRGESVDWFEPPPESGPPGAGRYSFLGNQLRAGLRLTFPHVQLTLEAQDTRLADLPEDASLRAPAGNLGPGAAYFAHTRSADQGETFLKQAMLTFRRSGLSFSLGRFEYSDGLESLAADPTLAWLERSRLAERLVGPYGYTHVTRSFDGLRVAYDRPGWNATAFASRPSHGGFEVSANREIAEIGLASLALTAKQLPGAPPTDLRLFYLFYEDRRDDPVKVDNRPLPLRTADRGAIRVQTWGGHAATAVETGAGIADGLVWTALQTGSWGALDHRAWAYAVEAGYQLTGVFSSPWLRAGWNRSSGDGEPGDGDHETFFQVLPTARIYAQFPFFNLMNNDDRFVQLIVKPHTRVTVRSDYHWLRLTEGRDLWYSGGGATNDDVFGFTGIPAAGARDLARLVDLGITVQLPRKLTAYAYYGRAFGGAAVRSTFAGEDASYGYLELSYRY
jgi:hypothetical protein